MTHTVMAQRGLLHVGGVVAAGAGFVGVPADGGAGSFLCVVGFEVVGVRVSLAIAALAYSAVGRGGAGGRRSLRVVCGFPVNRMLADGIGDFCRVLGFRGFHIGGRGRANVVVRIDVKRAVGGVGAVLAGFIGIPADFRAGRSLRVILHQIVGVGVCAAVAALAHSAVGRGDAGGRRCRRVGGGYPIDRMPAASIGDLCRVLGLGGFHVGGCGLADMVVGCEVAVRCRALRAYRPRGTSSRGLFAVTLKICIDFPMAALTDDCHYVRGVRDICIIEVRSALVFVRVLVGTTAVQARHTVNAGCIAAVVGMLDV